MTANAEPTESEPTEPPPTVSYGPDEAEQRAADLIHAYRTLGQPPAEDGGTRFCRCTTATESMKQCPVHQWDYPPRYMPTPYTSTETPHDR